MKVPSGNSPLLPFCICLPRYHPSPKSSSRSMSSILSPFDRLSSSLLRASKSSGVSCQSSNLLKICCRCLGGCSKHGKDLDHLSIMPQYRDDSRMTSSISPGRAFFGDAPGCLYAIVARRLAPPGSLASGSVWFHRRGCPRLRNFFMSAGMQFARRS